MMLMQHASPQNKLYTSNKTQTYFCLGFLTWSLAHVAHITCWHTQTSEFRIGFYLFPAQPPHGDTQARSKETWLPPFTAARGQCATTVRAKATFTVLSALPPLQQICLYISLSQSLTSAGTLPFPLPISLPRHSRMYCWATLPGHCLCIPVLKASCFNLLPLQNCVPLHYPKR